MRAAVDVTAVPARPAGAGVYVLRLVEALAAGGEVDLALVARRDDGDRWRRFGAVSAAAPACRPLRLAWEQALAPRVAAATGADVWHGPHYTLPLRAPLPLVVTVHDLTFFDHPEWHERTKVAYFRRMIAAAVRRADVVVCVSHHTARRLDAVLAPRAPIAVVPHGVDHTRFTTAVDGDAERLAALGVRAPFVAFVGTIEPRKGLAVLGEAFAAVRRHHPDLTLVVAGAQGWGDEVVGEGVTHLGYVDDAVVPALFRSAAAVAYPSLEEGFGLPALEALACGAALVTTTGSAMEEVVGEAALLVPPGDVGALAEALGVLVGGTGEHLRARGPTTAAGYTWAACAAAHVEAYRRAVARGARR